MKVPLIRRGRRGSSGPELVDQLRAQLDALRDENAQLRLESQRVLSTGQAGAHMRDIAEATLGRLGPELRDALDSGDDVAAVADALAEAEVVRNALIAVCEDLVTSVGQMQRRLVARSPATEIDRRLRDRRGDRGEQPRLARAPIEDAHGPDGVVLLRPTAFTDTGDPAWSASRGNGSAHGPSDRLPGAQGG